MSKRNIILITIVLVIIVIIAFVFIYSYKPANNTGGGTTSGINFISNLFPFGKSTTTNTGSETPPVNVSGYVPPATTGTPKQLLAKISSMPIAGYTVFMKERYTAVPAVTLNPSPALSTTTATDNSTTNTPLPNLPLSKGEEQGGGLTPPIPIVPTPPATEFASSLRYVERATGNIYETFADNIDERKFTTTVIPQVYDAYFGGSGQSLSMRYLKEDGRTIETFAGTLPKEVLGQDSSVSNEITGAFLPENITDISISPNTSSMFYLFESGNGTIGVTATLSGNSKNQIFNSPFTEWLSQWPNTRMITLTTKPSYATPGYMYSLDPSLKKVTKILSGINGLTTLTSPSGKLVLYNDNNLALRVYNTDTENSVSIGIKTMPEKCVWGSDSTTLYCAVPKYVDGRNFPDTWYQGEVSFSDDLWKINVENGNATDIADPTAFTEGEEIDGIKLSLDQNGDYLFFVNKKDSYLWELKLK